MPAIIFKQDSEIDMNEGRFDCDIEETPATSIAG